MRLTRVGSCACMYVGAAETAAALEAAEARRRAERGTLEAQERAAARAAAEAKAQATLALEAVGAVLAGAPAGSTCRLNSLAGGEGSGRSYAPQNAA